VINRRQLVSGSLAAPLVLRTHTGAQEPLRVLGWGGYADQGVLDRFRALTGVEVIVDTVGAYDEIFLRMRSGGLGRYSVIAPHHGLVSALLNEGMVQPLDLNQLPNLGSIDPRFLVPEAMVIGGNRYAVPLVWGTCPCIYNADLLPEPPASWTDLDTEPFTGKIGMQDDGLSHFNLWGRVAGAIDAPNLQPEEFERTVALLTNLKQYRVGHFTPYPADLSEQLASGAIWLTTTGWEGMLLLPEAEGANLRIARPGPGDYSWLQTLAVTAEAPMPEAAHAFINFMLGLEEQAWLANRTLRSIVRADAVPLIDEPVRNLTSYSDLNAVFSLSPLLGFPPLGDSPDGTVSYLDWVTAWEGIRLVKSEAAI
jgi:spermidine/putrescine-binding protein